MKWIMIFFLMLTSCFGKKGDESYNWLEDIDSKVALKWVSRESEKSLNELSKVEGFKQRKADILKRLESKDKLLNVYQEGDYIYNLWKDAEFPRGLWRRTPYKDYVKGKSKNWEKLLDVGLLSKQENKKWVFKYAQFITKETALIAISDGGKDAVYLREFSLKEKKFLKSDASFDFPESRYQALVLNENQILIANTSDKEFNTRSNYPRRMKLFTRGEDLNKSPTVLTIDKSHTAIWSYRIPLKNNKFHFVIYDAVDFFNPIKYLYKNNELIKIPIPNSTEILNAYGNTFILSITDDILEKNIKAGDIASITLKKDGSFSEIEKLLSAKEGQAITGADVTKDFILFTVRENVSKKVFKFSLKNKKLTPLKVDVEASVMDTSHEHNTALIKQYDFLNPYQLFSYNLKSDAFNVIQKEAAYFKPDAYTYSQDWAISDDGTRIPFYVVHRKDIVKDGTNPTIMYGYGGFNSSQSPFYLKNRVPEWISKGGVFVLTNIRGGGEFGPAWHKAAQKHNKKKSYEDFAAIARRLFELKITSSDHLGIAGGSNGGLLVGASTVLFPELYKSVFCAVPLLDMLRYDQLLVGASWMMEYGDPKIKKDRDYIKTYSPFQNLEKEQDYPTVLFYTSTFDDRVHPGHARKMYKKMTDQGHEALYYENSEGGHAGSSNLEQLALSKALKYSFFKKTLGLK